jgi:hypothetical protein
MKKILLLSAILLLPIAADADTALLLNENAALFTINFTIDDDDFMNEVPLIARHGIAYNDRVNVIGYDVASADSIDESIELISAIVLADAPINQNARYNVPVNTPTTFTLLILADFGTPLPETSYQARITKLPYWLDGKRTTVHQNQLDDLSMPVLDLE